MPPAPVTSSVEPPPMSMMAMSAGARSSDGGRPGEGQRTLGLPAQQLRRNADRSVAAAEERRPVAGVAHRRGGHEPGPDERRCRP